MTTSATPPARRGPRGKAGHSRESILDAARRLFAEHDYAAVSVRQVAREAGVDTALVGYYFETKLALYTAAMILPKGPHQVVAEVCAVCPPEELGEGLLRAVMEAWEGFEADASTGRTSLQGVLQAAVSEPGAFEGLRHYEQETLVAPITAVLEQRFGHDEAERRAGLAVSHLAGLLVTRHVVGLPVLARLDAAELLRRETPALQHTLTGS